MQKLFNLSLLTAERREEITTTGAGSYTFDLRRASVEKLDRASRGYSVEALRILAGRVVVFETFDDENGTTRAQPLREMFTASEARYVFPVGGASFRLTALSDNFSYIADNALFRRVALCTECGKIFAEMPTAHDCAEVCCTDCGQVLTAYEKKHGSMCTACKARRVARVCGYHGRANRANPLFDRKDKRASILHIGAEIEIEGTRRFQCTDETGRALSQAVNEDPFVPLFEFERDGSINEGVECISRPLTWDAWKHNREKVSALYATASERGGKFDSLNGVHFHIDRAFFNDESEETKLRAPIFMELMVYKCFDFFALVSRRKATAFYYATKKEGVNGVISATLKASERDHRYAVNTCGSNTVELRFFGGDIAKAEDFFACLDMAQAIARWAKCATLADAEKCKPADIVKYIRDAENVLRFVTHPRTASPCTGYAQEMRDAFVIALKKKMGVA